MADINARLGNNSVKYVPPAKRGNKSLDKSKQLESWEALRKRINGLINKANIDNIQDIVIELLKCNLIRGRGLLCKSLLQSQMLAMSYTPIYAGIVAVINSKFPDIGKLLIYRLVINFRRAFEKNDKSVCDSSTRFIAHLVIQKVAHEILALEILTLLLETATDDAIEIAVAFLKEIGPLLQENNPKASDFIYERCLAILHEGDVSLKSQYTLEVIIQMRKTFGKAPLVLPELDLVEEEDQVVHMVGLDDEDIDAHDELDCFKETADFEADELKFLEIKREILGDESTSVTSEDELQASDGDEAVAIVDETETDLLNLRKTVYLTIMSSAGFEECCHKLLKLTFSAKQRPDICQVVMECCSQERVFSDFYGLLAQRLCNLDYKAWGMAFEGCFSDVYSTAHRYELGRIRNLARLFSFLLASDALDWRVLDIVVLTEDGTTPSSRIFLKALFQDMLQSMGLVALKEHLLDVPRRTLSKQRTHFARDSESQETYPGCAFPGMFPHNLDSQHVRFAINYWTSIGLGALTDELREYLKQCPVTKSSDYFGDESSSGYSSSPESDDESD